MAGAVIGALVYVHPIAPLYCALAAGTGLIVAERLLARSSTRRGRGAVAAAVVAAPYAYALAVLRSRYDVGLESSRLRTTAGRSVPEEALHALTPGGTLGAVVLLALALVGLASLVRLRRRAAVALALWLAVPVLFFTLVPASTRFFGRYLAPAEPAFYVLVAAGLPHDRRAPARGRVGSRGRRRRALGLRADRPPAHDPRSRPPWISSRRSTTRTVLFSSTGTPVSDRPPELLDDYLDLEDARRPAGRGAAGDRPSLRAQPRAARPGKCRRVRRGRQGRPWPLDLPRAGAARDEGDPAPRESTRSSSPSERRRRCSSSAPARPARTAGPDRAGRRCPHRLDARLAGRPLDDPAARDRPLGETRR